MQDLGTYKHVFCGSCTGGQATHVCAGYPLCRAVICGSEVCARNVVHVEHCPYGAAPPVLGNAYGLSLSLNKTGEKEADKAIETMATLFESNYDQDDVVGASKRWTTSRDAFIRSVEKRVNPSKLKGDGQREFVAYKNALEGFLNALWRYGTPSRPSPTEDMIPKTGEKLTRKAADLFGATEDKFRSIVEKTIEDVRDGEHDGLRIMLKRIWLKSERPGILRKAKNALRRKGKGKGK